MTVAELLERMPARELDEWIAFYELEPFGFFVDEHYMTTLLALTYNAHSGSKKVKPADFAIGEKVLVQRKPEEMLSMMQSAFGKT